MTTTVLRFVTHTYTHTQTKVLLSAFELCHTLQLCAMLDERPHSLCVTHQFSLCSPSYLLPLNPHLCMPSAAGWPAAFCCSQNHAAMLVLYGCPAAQFPLNYRCFWCHWIFFPKSSSFAHSAGKESVAKMKEMHCINQALELQRNFRQFKAARKNCGSFDLQIKIRKK